MFKKSVSIILVVLMAVSVFVIAPFSASADVTPQDNWNMLREKLKGETNKTYTYNIDSDAMGDYVNLKLDENNKIVFHRDYSNPVDDRYYELKLTEVDINSTPVVNCEIHTSKYITREYYMDEGYEESKDLPPDEWYYKTEDVKMSFSVSDYGNPDKYNITKATSTGKVKSLSSSDVDDLLKKYMSDVEKALKEYAVLSLTDLGFGVDFALGINSINLYTTAPVDGAKPSYDITLPDNAAYKTEDTLNGSGWHNGVIWYDESGNPLGDDAVFEDGKTYKLKVSLVTESSEYEFNGETNLINAFVNDEKASAGWFSYEKRKSNIYVQCALTCKEPEPTTAAPEETTSPADKPTEAQETTAPVDKPTEPKETQPLKTDISNWNVSGIKNMTYTGKVLKQDNILVSKDGEYADFSVKYKNNVNVGTAEITITGTGVYTGTIVKSFKIAKAANTVKVTAKSKTIKLKNLKKKAQNVKAITVKKAKGKVTYKLIKNGTNKKIWKYLKISKKGVITFTKWKKAKKGKYKIKVTVYAAGNKSYKKGSKTVKFKIKIK